jgi:hypothetical protein
MYYEFIIISLRVKVERIIAEKPKIIVPIMEEIVFVLSKVGRMLLLEIVLPYTYVGTYAQLLFIASPN